jgi:hypothetical protein
LKKQNMNIAFSKHRSVSEPCEEQCSNLISPRVLIPAQLRHNRVISKKEFEME